MIDHKIDIVHAHGTRANSSYLLSKKLGYHNAILFMAGSFHQDQNHWLKFSELKVKVS
jgi:hypothetical protein